MKKLITTIIMFTIIALTSTAMAASDFLRYPANTTPASGEKTHDLGTVKVFIEDIEVTNTLRSAVVTEEQTTAWFGKVKSFLQDELGLTEIPDPIETTGKFIVVKMAAVNMSDTATTKYLDYLLINANKQEFPVAKEALNKCYLNGEYAYIEQLDLAPAEQIRFAVIFEVPAATPAYQINITEGGMHMASMLPSWLGGSDADIELTVRDPDFKEPAKQIADPTKEDPTDPAPSMLNPEEPLKGSEK